MDETNQQQFISFKIIGVVIICLLALMACRESSNSDVDICTVLEAMLEEDQLYRNDKHAYAALYIADSLYKMEHGPAEIDFVPVSYSNRGIAILKDHREEDFIDTQYADSIFNLQYLTDMRLTIELIDFINENRNRIDKNQDCFKKSLVIFAHTRSEQMPIVREFLKNNQDLISEAKKNYILNAYTYFERS